MTYNTVHIEDNSEKFKDAMAKAAYTAMEAAGLHLEGQAKKELQNAPSRIDTGLLRNSITHAMAGEAPAIRSYRGDRTSRYKDGGRIPEGSYFGSAPAESGDTEAVYIGTNVEYAPYIHEGTDRLTPNRFLKNAVEKNAAQVQRNIKAALENA